ncbi:uncharacterized protein PV06_08839 [Exophiala oligosperma]|uniref:Lysophospholipase n=1 Tax=Exophiala oligosperma TaxID=215243 RepID=A0A0D2BNG8_9EURO|nr:uncharacterized protein PV06_08839 [Exophiala oligosperma]KIW39022.1 hypothetical protein PV06_08839 [Exophiala oligosperma]
MVTWATALVFAIALILPIDQAFSETDNDVKHVAGSRCPRALPNAPNGYAPASVECPIDRPVIRNANGLSRDEIEWLQNRRPLAISAMHDLLHRLNITGFDARGYIDLHLGNESNLPTIGIAVSGGGHRALLNGAGAVAALDARTESSTLPGHLGGILQAATYISGLSGGGWLLGSIFVNNFTTIPALLGDSTPGGVWDFNQSILIGPLGQPNYYRDLRDSVLSKRDAGFNVSITDPWARALSFQLINGTDGGISYTWSSLALQSTFSGGNMPMPIITALERAPNNREQLIAANATSFEFNPWEMGSFDPTTYAFAPLKYIGSNFSNGALPDDEACIGGLDNAGFVMGTSSSIFNQVLIEVNRFETTSSLLKNLTTTLAAILTNISEANLDIAIYEPNPFYGFNNGTNHNAHSSELHLVDAALDLQNLPLPPLLYPARNLDVVFAVDSSADTRTNWPNGASMVATYERYQDPRGIGNGTSFPSTPDTNTFVNLGLNARPTFFGCNSSNMTGPGPVIVYIPNAPYSYFSNVSTFELTYNASTRNAIVQNGYNVATQANGSLDTSWPACVGCAILTRSFERTETEVPDQYQKCFERYCWDGALNSTNHPSYDPKLALAPPEDKKKNAAPKVVSSCNVIALVVAVQLSVLVLSSIQVL